ncbi:RNA polymerase sigma24 factor [Actinorhabdospora filicis]|uniref:RNA polymerase sigma24 factor n=1 Tax=Actinorhabdospora filicis TaxID=1785913 RepID=A0A9W6SHW8_9ACTN|nr:SigE family RNA polymerase sigma factor [Actinorhabdospora filicis]GLZ77425.1 RNA polymerase sigma24 factor [Actinorhabdospora filicis]
MRADREAEYRDFVTTRGERLRRYAYLCCGDWHLAEDVTQNALVRLYAAWGRARKESVDAYARRIITNALIDERRRGWFRRERVAETLPDAVTAHHDDGRAERLTLLDAVFRLTPKQRAAVVLRYWEDLPIEQTARILNCSTGAVKGLTTRGLDTLRGLLTDEVPLTDQGATS